MLPYIEFLIFPFAANAGRSLVHVLIEEFSKPDWSRFRAAIAFARFSGSYVEVFDAMKQFARRGGRIDLTFGADKFSGDSSGSQYVAIQEVLVRIGSEKSVNVYLYHECGRTFHPKVYVFSNEPDQRALVVLGSSNWSDGGFHNNVEANVLLRLDLRNPIHRKCYEDICTCFEDSWATAENTFSRRVTLETLPEFAPLLSFSRPDVSGQDDPELKRAESLFKGKSLATKLPFKKIKSASHLSPANNEDSLAGILPGASSELLSLLDNAKQFFLCNTDRSHSTYSAHGGYELEQLMWSNS